MQVKSVEYSRLKNVGNYENEKAGIVVELNDGDSPQEAYERAKRFVDRRLEPRDDSMRAYYQKRVDNPDDYKGREVREAQEWLDAHPLDDAAMEF